MMRASFGKDKGVEGALWFLFDPCGWLPLFFTKCKRAVVLALLY